MFNLIPQFIHNEFKKGEYKGDCEVITMFMDISGFTAMTERLMNEGKEGAEVLSSILNGVFEPVIDAVYNRGGFISTFAGDAFTAIFSKDIEPVKTLYSAGEINNIFKEKGIQRTRFGDFDLSVKIGLSYGNVEWGIIGDSEYKAYFFKGEAVEGAALSEQKCDKMQIITDDKLLSLIPKNQQHIFNTIKHNEQYYRINEINMSLEKDTEPVSEKGNMSVDLDRDIVKLFMPDNVINYSGIGELRDIVSVFISLNEELHNYEDLNTFVKNTLEELNNIGGYFKGFDFGDKGGTLLAIFGAPVSYENNIIRALNFILTVKEIYGDKIKAGISYGTVYTGIVGSKRRYNYDVLGDIVNLSSRLMSNAGWGNIWLSKKMGEKQTEEFQIKPVGKISIKGKTDEEMVYELLGKKDKKSEKSYKGEMVGREEESKILNEYLKPVFNNKFGGMIYIYGEAGIGKSRFVYENIKSYEGQINHCILQTDNMQ